MLINGHQRLTSQKHVVVYEKEEIRIALSKPKSTSSI